MHVQAKVAKLAVGIVPVFPRQFYLYAVEPGLAFDRLVEMLQDRRLAEPHAHTDGGTVTIGARTATENIPTRIRFGDLAGPQLADSLADTFRDLAVRDAISVRVYLRKDAHEGSDEDQVEMGLPGTDMEADHAALRRLLNGAAAEAGLMTRG